MNKEKIIGWAIRLIGAYLLVSITEGFKEYITLLLGITTLVIGDKIADGKYNIK